MVAGHAVVCESFIDLGRACPDVRTIRQVKAVALHGIQIRAVAKQRTDVRAGSAYSARRLNERTLEITDKIKDKVTDTQQIELSPDLKTLTQTVRPMDQGSPNILVFERE